MAGNPFPISSSTSQSGRGTGVPLMLRESREAGKTGTPAGHISFASADEEQAWRDEWAQMGVDMDADRVPGKQRE